MKNKKHCNVREHCHHAGEYRDAAHSICNLKYSVLKKIPIGFQNGSNNDYHFIMKKLAEEFEKQFTCLGENNQKYIIFTLIIKNEITRIDKNREKIIKKIYLTYYNLLIGKICGKLIIKSCQIIVIKKLIALNVNWDTIIKNVKLAELHTKYVTVFLNTQTLKMI